MRLTVYTLLALFSVTSAQADQVTSDEALQMARQFITQQSAKSGGPRRANAQEPQLKMESQICGLYVFNVADGGYVIVSNDDATEPILGFSNSGSIDPANIPDNMRAWLQGYADQINWLRQNGASAAMRTKSIRKSIAEDNIPNLIETKWGQDYPYNYLCPTIESEKCVTGCIATAMAQIMYYHQWPKQTKAIIPGYGKLDDIPKSATINWSGMESNSYYTAQLFLYCGQSVKMNYGTAGSNAYPQDIVPALINYFDYASSTQILSRSYYSSENWMRLIYNELSQNRPVIYSGNAVDNGHTFICDGYMYEDNMDLFHINWGWDGNCDGYFVLSILNPDQQGAGGSISNSSYTFGHTAIVGIQKNGGTGTVLNDDYNEVNLSCTDIKTSHDKIALGESLDVTITVKNNSLQNDYDGDIRFVTKRSENNTLGPGKMYIIEKGQTKDCIINFIPQETGTYELSPAIPTNTGLYTIIVGKSVTITVVDQTPTNVAVTPSSEKADISWTNTGNANNWNLKYRTINKKTYNFNTNPNWETYNQQSGDSNWAWNSTLGCYENPSYKEQDLNPDDWLIMPQIVLGGTLSFEAWGTDDSDESFRIWISNNGNNFTTSYMTQKVSSTRTLYTFDLSNYSDTGWIVISHENSAGNTKESYLYIDNLSYITPNEWETINGITANNYTLTDLKPVSTYELLVQPINNDGGNWSESVMFETTNDLTFLNDDSEGKNLERIEKWYGVHADVTLEGRTILCDGSWNTLCLPFNFGVNDLDNVVSGVTFTAKVFDQEKSTLSDNGTLTLAFKTATGTIKNGTPFIIKCNNPPTTFTSINMSSLPFSNVAIDGNTGAQSRLTQTSNDGNVQFVGQWSNFDITDDNIKEILYIASGNRIGYAKSPRTLKGMRAHFWVQPKNKEAAARAIRLDWGDGEVTSINLVENDAAGQSEWYSVDGRRIDGQPASKGVYVSKGKKVVITK